MAVLVVSTVSFGRISATTDGVDWDVKLSGDGYNLTAIHNNGSLWGVCSRQGYLYYSSDGSTWVETFLPGSFNDLDYGGSQTWGIVGDDATFYTVTNLASLDSAILVDPDEFLSDSGYPDLLAVCLKKFSGSCTWFCSGNDGSIWKTSDKTALTGWEQVYDGANNIVDITYDPVDGTVFAAGASNTILYSTNNGLSWGTAGGDLDTLTQRSIDTISYSPTLDVWIGTTASNALYVSADWTSGNVEEVVLSGNSIRGVAWSPGLNMFILGSSSNVRMIAAVDAAAVPAVFAGGPVLGSVTVGSLTLNFYEAEPAFEAGAGDDVGAIGEPKECACEAYGPATPGEITKVGRFSEARVAGKPGGPGLYMATDHVDTMWCRRTQAEGPVEG